MKKEIIIDKIFNGLEIFIIGLEKAFLVLFTIATFILIPVVIVFGYACVIDNTYIDQVANIFIISGLLWLALLVLISN